MKGWQVIAAEILNAVAEVGDGIRGVEGYARTELSRRRMGGRKWRRR